MARLILILAAIMLMTSQCMSGIILTNKQACLKAGILERDIVFDGRNCSTASLMVDGDELLADAAREFSVTFTRAEPNERPRGIRPGEVEGIEQKATVEAGTDALDVKEGGSGPESVKWVDPVTVSADSWASALNLITRRITHPEPGVTRLTLRARATTGTLRGVSISLFYEVCDGYPVVRKWVEVANNGRNWLKIEKLVIDDIALSAGFLNRTLLTPEERGACSSIIAFGSDDLSHGVIAVSEIPSALRSISETGAMGYAEEHFEWVLGPSERFTSEPVFLYAYSGPVERTISGISTPLDRAVERPFQRFLKDRIGIAADPNKLPVPLWCSWSNFGSRVDDANMREMAELAAKAGFACFQIDAGWHRGPSWDCGDAEHDPVKFPDFKATTDCVCSKGLRFGLWVSDFRRPDSQDLRDMPNARSLPEIKRGGGLGMSFASPWRDYYADSLVGLNERLGVTYIKQDLSNIRFGDIAEGHDSRTKKESLLRGLRGLLEAQDRVRRAAPGMALELTHEIYWGTPGVPADIAALKHADSYHIPPNDYSGCGNRNQRPTEAWTYKPEDLRAQLIRGCANARQRLYAHRGLPLHCIEYYAAATVNFRGSLTPEVQDRQVCSWLMGAPTVFAGDLASLTPENLAHYRKRFDLLARLHKTYGIYGHFQYSGVPAPTDTDLHWWGKLNHEGCGAVVVIRGSGGSDEREINIPWVMPDRKYRVTALFSGKALGTFSGSDLQKGKLKLSLPVLGQEILELTSL